MLACCYCGDLSICENRCLRCLKESVEQLGRKVVVNLAQTRGAFLTSLRGIGIVLAAGVTAETGMFKTGSIQI